MKNKRTKAEQNVLDFLNKSTMKHCFVCKGPIEGEHKVMVAPLGCNWPGQASWDVHDGDCFNIAEPCLDLAFKVIQTGKIEGLNKLARAELIKDFLISMVPKLKGKL